ncbi:WD repeat-containing protein 5 [Hypsibius exemplaris]|uniref:WD repeat-containing protein 5 n=1 Tax=Hypsibius exemplaris TaxID=2072580 RepID=A0A1W0WJS8_HYPEX|nr:WD repeat-containing protein 5 [Hypsibius exemplaris]
MEVRDVSPEIPLRPPRLFLPTTNGRGRGGGMNNVMWSSKLEADYLGNLTLEPAHSRGISSLKFHPNGTCLCSAGADGFIFLWNHVNGGRERQLLGHQLGVDEVQWSNDGRFLASASDDRTVKIWDVEKGVCIRTMRGHEISAFSCAWNVQGNMIASGGADGMVIYWDTRTGTFIRTVACHTSYPVTSLEFHKDSHILLSASTDGLCRIWEVATGHCLKTLVEQSNPMVGSARFSPNGRYILVSHVNSSIKLWDYLRTKEKRAFQGHENEKYCIPASFLCGGRSGEPVSVVSGSEDGKLYVWDVNTRKVLKTLEYHKDVCCATACHPFQRIIASGGLEKDRSIRIWNNL